MSEGVRNVLNECKVSYAEKLALAVRLRRVQDAVAEGQLGRAVGLAEAELVYLTRLRDKQQAIYDKWANRARQRLEDLKAAPRRDEITDSTELLVSVVQSSLTGAKEASTKEAQLSAEDHPLGSFLTRFSDLDRTE